MEEDAHKFIELLSANRFNRDYCGISDDWSPFKFFTISLIQLLDFN